MKRLGILFLALALLLPCLWTAGAAEGGGTTLYHGTPGTSWANTIQFWQTNTAQGWRSFCITDEFGTQPSAEFYNSRIDGSGLPEGEGLCIELVGLSIPTAGYPHVVLSLQYARCPASSDVLISEANRFLVSVSCDGGQSWSENAAGFIRHEPVAVGKISSDREVLIYQVSSRDLASLVPQGAVIDRIRILPFGDHPFCAGAFRVQWIDVTGYPSAQSAPAPVPEPEPIPVSEDVLRQISVQRIYEIVEEPWIPSEEIVSYMGSHREEWYTYIYKPGWLYKGPVYSQSIDSTLELLRSAIDGEGVYHGGTTVDTVYGMDCIKVVSNALSGVSNARHDTWVYAPWDPRLKLMGELKQDKRNEGTVAVIADNGDAAVLESYALLRPGDYVLSQKGVASDHIRMATLPPTVVRFPDGSLDAANSVAYLSETKAAIEYHWRTPQGKEVVSTGKDPADYQQAHPDDTYLYGSSCRKDKPYTFQDLLDSNYLAYTPEEYELQQVKGLRLLTLRATAADRLRKDGFSAFLDSNWPMIALDTALKDASSGQILWQKRVPQFTGVYQTGWRDAGLNETLAALPVGEYVLTLDVTAGPITAVGGARPVTRAVETAFRISAPADLNEDGKVNGKDVTLLQRFVVGGYGVTLEPGAADLNGDGKQNGKDVTLLQRFVVGGYGVTL